MGLLLSTPNNDWPPPGQPPASPMYDADMQHLEFGIDPDIKVNMSSEDMQRNVDTIIEAAREYLHSHKE